MNAGKKPPLRVTATSASTSRDVDISEINLSKRQTRQDKPTVVYKLVDSRIPRSGSKSGDSSPEVFASSPSASTSNPLTPSPSQSRTLPVLLVKRPSRNVYSQTDAQALEVEAAAAEAPADADPLVQQHQEAINLAAMAQPPAAAAQPIQISGDGALLPTPFEGKASEDATKWLAYFKQYSEYKSINGQKAQLELFKLLMRGQAHDWFTGLEGNMDTFDLCEQAFDTRYKASPITRFKSAKDMYSRRQDINESCDDYVTAMRQIARRISEEPNEEMLRYAILSGLRDNIANFVLAKAPKTIAELLDAGRIAELTVSPDMSVPLMQQLSTMQVEMQRISRQLEQRTTSYIAPGPPSPVGVRRVSFASPAAAAHNAPTSPNVQRRSFDRRQQQQPPTQRGNGSFNRNQRPQDGPSTNQGRCNRCGYAHERFRCPAEGKTCHRCGRVNHFISQCRSSARDNGGPRQ